MSDDAARFWAKVDKSGDCWLWTASVAGGGYGRFWFEGGHASAHRWAYVAERGPIPDGLILDHLCRNRACVNPDHLEPVTQRENTIRGETNPAANLAKSCCPAGHLYAGANLRITNGRRVCRTCHRINAARSRNRGAA